jgi:hypothetical protein
MNRHGAPHHSDNFDKLTSRVNRALASQKQESASPILAELEQSTSDHERDLRLALFWHLLMRGGMMDSAEIPEAIRNEAHAAFLRFNFYDLPLSDGAARLLIRCVTDQGKSVAEVWREFVGDIPLPEFPDPKPISSVPKPTNHEMVVLRCI